MKQSHLPLFDPCLLLTMSKTALTAQFQHSHISVNCSDTTRHSSSTVLSIPFNTVGALQSRVRCSNLSPNLVTDRSTQWEPCRAEPFNTVGALQRAKHAVERHYAVVGILEDLNSTLTVLEHYVPRFFKGASQVYWDEVDRFTRINRNMFKPPVKEEVKDLVRRNFTREVEFYEFCRQRLHRQFLALRLQGA
uniref:Uncharacterized protein n=1 Tax=Timema monikensis TaxID=170555 RepID=A0A7R9EH71_9NEOP|nr:unnamed protein product [Timema monikensis]